MSTRRPRRGWLATLRRFSGVGMLLFAAVFLVGTVRAQALALGLGDDELCLAMGGTVPRFAEAPAPSSDLADPHHTCCDLGLCLDASALPPTAPTVATLARIGGRDATRRPRRVAPAGASRRAHRPRAPPRP